MKQQKRELRGVLVLDKPTGMTSMKALAIVKRLLRCKKAGHTGTLDPLATGVLPICFGKATGIARYLLADDKTYRVTFQLGISTDTCDSEGEILLERPVPAITAEQAESVLDDFRGEQMQRPPAYSALKVDGKRAYELARKGEDVKLAPRPVIVHELVMEEKTDNTWTLFCHVSKGTYIRSLVRDIGEKLSCGAHLTSLRRLQSGQFSLEDAWTLEEIEEDTEKTLEAIQPLQQVLREYPILALEEEEAFRLSQGLINYQLRERQPEQEGLHLALRPDGELLALLRTTEEEEKPWKIEKVFPPLS